MAFPCLWECESHMKRRGWKVQSSELCTPKPLSHGVLPEEDQKASDLQQPGLTWEKIKKTLNFLNKFKVKLSVTEHAALCLPYFRTWLQVSDFLSCSQQCLSKWISGEPRAWLLSAHSSAISWSLCPRWSCSWAVLPVFSPLPSSQIFPLTVLSSTKGSLILLLEVTLDPVPALRNTNIIGVKWRKRILLVTKGMKDPPLNLMSSALPCSPVTLMMWDGGDFRQQGGCYDAYS